MSLDFDCRGCSATPKRCVDSVTVKVPASTSNLGSGFDTLGLAVELYASVAVTRIRGRGVHVFSEPALPARDRPAAQSLATEASEAFFRATKLKPVGIEVSCRSGIPIARGLGFSAALRAGIVGGLNELSAKPLAQTDLLDIVTRLEGHPDNASPALLGGFTVSGIVNGATRCLRFDVDSALKIVTLIPKFNVRTSAARRIVPKEFSKADTAHALNRSALIVAAFASRNYDALRGVFDDRFHQPSRRKLVPQLDRVIEAGVAAGAIGGFLSGSGSSIICLTLANAEQVAAAMQSELTESEVKILAPENQGFAPCRR